VRVTFTRPDYTWITQYVVPDPETGEFTVTQTLDMVGYWKRLLKLLLQAPQNLL
jgi:hypothetical protein